MKKKYYNKIIGLVAFCTIASCDDFVKIDAPRTALTKEAVFASDQTANAAMLDLYYHLATNSSGFASGTPSSLSFWTTYLSDEQENYFSAGTQQSVAEHNQFNDNEVLPNNVPLLRLWTSMYNSIYRANSILEGVHSSTELSDELSKQLEGEAKFIRAFCHFYLVNLWGDVPLVLSTDYKENSNIPRSAKSDVYQQIINDLIDSESLLPEDYSFANEERVRATKGAVNAFLARVYLYQGSWANAEARATSVIENSSLYSLTGTVDEVFLTNSSEAILQWWSLIRPNDRGTFRVSSTPFRGAIRPDYASSFDPSDARGMTWLNLNGGGYYNARKYDLLVDNPSVQYSTVFRLAEQYLIRAEARAHLDNFSGSQEDINIIRNRAGLSDTPGNDQGSLLLAIEDERKFELFTEWGHRWFDLIRTNRADAVIGPIKPQWQSTDVLLPIPVQEMRNNLGLQGSQNPGY